MKISIPVKRDVVKETVEVELPAYRRILDDFENGRAESSAHYKIINEHTALVVHVFTDGGKIQYAEIKLDNARTFDRHMLETPYCQSNKEQFDRAWHAALDFMSKVRDSQVTL